MVPPYVVKTDGLAAGKGVLVTDDLGEAEADVRAKLAGEAFGDAGRTVVIEEGMTGPGGVGLRASATAPGRSPSTRPRTSSGSATATPGPTPAGWAPTARCRGCEPGFTDDVDQAVRAADPRRAPPPRHRLPGRALHRPDASPTRARSSSSTTSASATPTARSCSCGSPPTSRELLVEAAAGELRTPARASTPDAAVLVVVAAEGYPAAVRTGRRHPGPRRRRARRRRRRALRRGRRKAEDGAAA